MGATSLLTGGARLLHTQKRFVVDPRVLSIQSHVVSGYVGNKSAVFPLQLLGYDVDILNTVQFSNHTGYPSWGGSKLSAEEMEKIVEGLKTNGLASSITHILQGYCPSSQLLRVINKMYCEMKKENPDLCYVCDPVMGDNGKLYVSEDLVDTYCQVVAPSADFLIPNQFEAELLTGMSIHTKEDAAAVCDCLHEKGVRVVVITSLYYTQDDHITLMGSRRAANGKDLAERFLIRMPSLPYYFTGTGDLFGSLLVGWSLKHPDNLALVCEKAVAGIRGVMLNTISAVRQSTETSPIGVRRASELRLIQSRNEIENPVIEFHSVSLT